MLWAQAWKPGSQHAGEKRGVVILQYWRRKWQPTPVFLPGESQGRGSLVGRRLWGRTESDTVQLKRLSSSSSSVTRQAFLYVCVVTLRICPYLLPI